MFNLSALRPAARVVAATTMSAMAGILIVVDAPAARPGRGMAQHAAPFRRPAPAFRAAPVRPRWGGGGYPYRGNPGLPSNAPHIVHPAPPENAAPPNGAAVQGGHPYSGSPALPLNAPHILRPNFPPGAPGAHEPGFANPAALPGNAAPPQGAAALGTGANPVTGQPPAGQPSISRLATPPPVSRPVVLRPLLKPPPGGFQQTKPAFPAVQRNTRFWPLFKDRKVVWMHGKPRVFVPVATLGAVLIGGSYWYPDGYVSAEGPACTGYTADGCQLEWRMVDLDDGGSEPQCVQYCPQAATDQAATASDQAATLPPPPPLQPDGACQVTIYSEPNFAGNSAPTGDSQPVLSTTGWRNEIASVVVAAGTWDFFADENFGGDSLRLPPGTYPTLPAEWLQHIGSFMCVEPGPPPT